MDICTIRALYNDNTITIYQAYNKDIASFAVKHQTFIGSTFKRERMTWIKPSFLWMMYRSAWGTKENQEHILAIKIKREGFEWALNNSCLSQFEKNLYSSYDDWKQLIAISPVRVQWDPEKNILLQPLKYKSIQIGLSKEAIEKYVSDWIVQIDDITITCRKIEELVSNKQIDQAENMLPQEEIYPLPDDIKIKIGITSAFV